MLIPCFPFYQVSEVNRFAPTYAPHPSAHPDIGIIQAARRAGGQKSASARLPKYRDRSRDTGNSAARQDSRGVTSAVRLPSTQVDKNTPGYTFLSDIPYPPVDHGSNITSQKWLHFDSIIQYIMGMKLFNHMVIDYGFAEITCSSL